MPVFLCQQDYAHVPYPSTSTHRGTMSDNGCGICSACMLAMNMLHVPLSLESCGRMAIDCGARDQPGTDLYRFAPVLADFLGLQVRHTMDAEEMLAFLKAHTPENGMVIANTRGDRPEDGYRGVFSDCGHYILLMDAREREIRVLDPMYRPYSLRYDLPWRRGRVRVRGVEAFADVSVIREDCRDRPFFLFSLKD